MLLSVSAISLSAATNLRFSSPNLHKTTSSAIKPLLLSTNASSSVYASLATTTNDNTSLYHVTNSSPYEDGEGGEMASSASASAVASAIRGVSTSPVEFVQRFENNQQKGGKLVLPSADFQRLCVEQLDLFRRIVYPDAILSVYVRPAGSYVMDQLELRRVTTFPGANAADIVILIGNFGVPTGLRAAEAALSSKQVEFVPELMTLVFPMVKHPFVVGFLVAELPGMEVEPSSGYGLDSDQHNLVHLPFPQEAHAFSSTMDKKSWGTLNDEPLKKFNFAPEQISNAINISRTLAMAYVMDQKAMLLQQSSWQNNVRMSKLVEQIRGPLSSIQTLSKMLSIHLKKTEISYDIVEDILVQGDCMKDTLQELQDAVYLTKIAPFELPPSSQPVVVIVRPYKLSDEAKILANIVRYNEEILKKIHISTHDHPESTKFQFADNFATDPTKKLQNSHVPLSPSSSAKDFEMPMPPLALAPLQHGIRPCDVSDVLSDLVEAVKPLAYKQQRTVEISEVSQSSLVAVEGPALRQALSNLIEGALLRTHVGGKVEILSVGAMAGGALVVIDDDGPDMHYMTQMHSLTPFGAELFSENMVEDSMTWNFVAGLTIAREILESYGCVVRVISPRMTDAALGAGGTRIELWLPSFAALSGLDGHGHESSNNVV